MKKRVTVLILIALILSVLLYFVGTGFNKRGDVVMLDYSVSDDGTRLTFETSCLSSIGYIRGFKNNGGGVKPHYLTFYSTFGGINSSFGAKNEFELDLEKYDTEIYFNRPNGGNELVLQKNSETGKWQRP